MVKRAPAVIHAAQRTVGAPSCDELGVVRLIKPPRLAAVDSQTLVEKPPDGLRSDTER